MMQQVPFYDLDITGGFWRERQQTVIDKTVWAVYDRFKETGRIDTMDCQKHEIKPHIFWDSDVAKWIEGVAYLTKVKKEPELEKIVDHVVDLIEKNQLENGGAKFYINLHGNAKRVFL